ncbi:hypothetical protein [Ferviditalea candida]|uniref:Uncharacterized protein n=1 Tax=Ferviditalea candida TaxID=3108399 RepID=A0ABU5ZJX8_9BACL|nr:hypothetical protein [Paenibacillaceae bacterium T2]
MPAISYKEFMEEVKGRLATLDHEKLLNLIISWADKTPSSKRQEFLDGFVLPEERKEAVSSAKTLLDEIEVFAKRVENGDYCDGWGWDEEIGEERDWGDEGWADEMDELFLQARSLLLQGEYRLAEDACTKLFGILEMGQEPGHLPGNPDYSTMLKADLMEQVALFLRCVYMNTAPLERPACVYEAMNDYGYLAGELKLQSIINASGSVLPDLDGFLAEWIDFLTRQGGVRVSSWLREAVWLKGGIPAISAFARQHADQYPRAYMDWIEALEKEADTEAVLQAAREGLAAIPRDYNTRSEVAGVLARIGEKRDDHALKLEGYKERFYSEPSIRHILDLYIAAIECGRWEEMRDQAEQRIMKLRGKGRASAGYYDRERQTSSVSEGIVCSVLLLGGRYKQVFEMCRNKGSLGWSSVDHPKPVVITFTMVVLAKKGFLSNILMKQWEAAIGNTSHEADKTYIEKYKQAADHARESIPFTWEQEQFYLQWCMDEAGRRVDGIVGNQHRGSYHKAAGLIVAVAEVLASREREQEGKSFIETYRGKYPRHSAFKSELTASMQASHFFNTMSKK